MGSDPAPFFANLFLYHYEDKWLQNMKNENFQTARKFGNVFRYIDDLLAINDGGEFESNYLDIYPAELELKKENQRYNEATYLDLHLQIRNKQIKTTLHDKRD